MDEDLPFFVICNALCVSCNETDKIESMQCCIACARFMHKACGKGTFGGKVANFGVSLGFGNIDAMVDDACRTCRSRVETIVAKPLEVKPSLEVCNDEVRRYPKRSGRGGGSGDGCEWPDAMQIIADHFAELPGPQLFVLQELVEDDNMFLEPLYELGDTVKLIAMPDGGADKAETLRIVRRYFEPGTTEGNDSDSEVEDDEDEAAGTIEGNERGSSLEQETVVGTAAADTEYSHVRRGWYYQFGKNSGAKSHMTPDIAWWHERRLRFDTGAAEDDEDGLLEAGDVDQEGDEEVVEEVFKPESPTLVHTASVLSSTEQ